MAEKRQAEGESEGGGAAAAAAQQQPPEEEEEEELRPVAGTGRISSSGTVVTGHGTRFMSELRAGDALIVTHPTSLAQETRLVRMVLSDAHAGVSSAFSTDLISTTAFQYVSAPRGEAEDPAVAAKRARLQEEDRAFGTYSSGGGSKVVYRVKKAGVYGGYEIVTADSKKSMTREELLNVRSKKKADRYCY
ncbi:hypothetical protein JKP88DRAFT_195709 [Tribonema minus]|uniref:Uncharacterized protein n=1 Tax=Tribonema minus TaxID=303371 RepID=A0A835Z5I8_9STRA|nr:hypothetical protein JKP88DRAFT_195709 [Tribonema minus]